MTDAFGEICRIEDRCVARIVSFDAGDDNGPQPHRFATVLIRPSDGHVHGGVAGAVEQRHHIEPDIACSDLIFEFIVQEVGRLRFGLVLGQCESPPTGMTLNLMNRVSPFEFVAGKACTPQ